MKLAPDYFAHCHTIICFIILSSASYADTNICAQVTKKISIENSLASAGTWSNLTGGAKSLSKESKRLLIEAGNGIDKAQMPKDLCRVGCSAEPLPEVIFQSVPNKILNEYSDQAKCLEKLAETRKTPLRYSNRHFSTLEDLHSWFSDFSVGSGQDGKDLYQKCNGSCSPQFSCEISRDSTGYMLNAFVICGEARDKDDNQYVLTTAYKWQCK